MKPRDLLKSRLESTFVPFMESEGFRYSQSQIKFSRKRGDFVQSVSFRLSRYNSENDCYFSTYWNVHSPAYSRWYQQEWGERPASNMLGGGLDMNIPGWDRGESYNFRLTNTQGDSAEIERLVRNVKLAGLPYLERISSWLVAAEELLQRNWRYVEAADFLLIANEKDRAKEALMAGLRSIEVEGRRDPAGDQFELKKRLDRYF